MCRGDNNDDDVTPVARVDDVVENDNNSENTSTAQDNDVPIVVFNGS